MAHYHYRPFPYESPPELAGGTVPERYPVVIVGAGPIGLTAAIELALHEIPSVVLDDNDRVSVGSRAICWSKRTLEIFDRLGVGARMLDKGVTWKLGRLFHRDSEVFSFDLLPEDGHKMPAFINLQQYYVEEYLIDRARDFPDLIDLRWKNRVVACHQNEDGAVVTAETPDGTYTLASDYVIACDGAHSPTRAMLGLDMAGQAFRERFLIADVQMKADFPSERWFWFEPPFHSGHSALLHKQPDDIYRIDLQLGPEADPVAEKQPENVIPRIRAMVGDVPFELDWVSVYSFQCRRLERFRHGRILFAGDSAHVVSPFGARGGNGGIQDVDNLVWKLAAVLKGRAPEGLLETYDAERIHGADENIRHSTRATNFMTPKSRMEKLLRDSVLNLAHHHSFARALVNSGRLSRPCNLEGFDLQSPTPEGCPLASGAPCPDAPVTKGPSTWLLDYLGGRFKVLSTGDVVPEVPQGLDHIHVGAVNRESGKARFLGDCEGYVAARYGVGWVHLIRPDQHVAASVPVDEAGRLGTGLERAQGGFLQ